MRKRGQLFLIEVIVGLTILLVLVTTLFSIQTFSPPNQDTNLRERGQRIIENLKKDGLIFDYFDAANNSFHVDGEDVLDSENRFKSEVIRTIKSGIPIVAENKAFTERFNSTSDEWIQIDTVNFETTLPISSNVVSVEYYTPGYNGSFVEFKFQLFLWYEVEE